MPCFTRRRTVESRAGLSAERFARLGLTVFLLLLLGTAGAMALDALFGLGRTAPDREESWWGNLTNPGDAPDDVLVVWTSGGLPRGLPERVAGLEPVAATSVVSGDLVDLTASWNARGELVDQPPEGMALPLDALAVDPGAHARVFGDRWGDTADNLAVGRALLSESSAEFRGLGEGAVLELAGDQRVTVAGVVDDVLVGSAELVVAASEGDARGVTTPRSLVLRYTGDRAWLEQAVRRAADRPVEVASPEEVRAFRHAGSVVPQITLKQRFGEFAYRGAEGRGIVQSDSWVDRNIVSDEVPILGEVTCHRELLPALRGALGDVRESGLRHTIDLAGYAGCYAPRLINADAGLSRHAWGVAVDLNSQRNAYGSDPQQDPRLVEIFERWGFTWGGHWLVPDGMHFEYARRPNAT